MIKCYLPFHSQVSISQADMQALGNTITMVTSDGTTFTVPSHEMLNADGTHSVTMVAADGTEEQVSFTKTLLP